GGIRFDVRGPALWSELVDAHAAVFSQAPICSAASSRACAARTLAASASWRAPSSPIASGAASTASLISFSEQPLEQLTDTRPLRQGSRSRSVHASALQQGQTASHAVGSRSSVL